MKERDRDRQLNGNLHVKKTETVLLGSGPGGTNGLCLPNFFPFFFLVLNFSFAVKNYAILFEWQP